MPIKTLKKHILVDEDAIVIDLENSVGSWLVDKRTGKSYLDCFSQFASQPVGWNHPKVIGQKDRLVNASLHKVANSDMYTQEYADFVETFAKITPDFPHHFYISGGALGVENALKAAFDWKYPQCNDPMDVIHLREAFHGRTGYTLSLTNNNDPYNPKTKWFPKLKWTRVANPKKWHPTNHKSTAKIEKVSLEQIEKALRLNNVAAIILEPIQGEGGDNHFRNEYFSTLRHLADQYDAMLIFDEVQTGVGLTGKMWAYEHFNCIPDMICFGKKMQVCGFCSTTRIDSAKQNVFTVPGRINSTWGGNLVDMVRATIFLEIIEEDELVENAREVGKYFLEKLVDMGLENARGRGLMIAFDHPERDDVLNKLSNNMLALPCGSQSVRFRPHLTFTREDVDTAIDFIKAAV